MPLQEDTIAVTGTLMWSKELTDGSTFNYLCGIELLSIKPEDKWTLMDYAYKGWEKDRK